jgi:peptide-methionine (S)-S-oxide reductase
MVMSGYTGGHVANPTYEQVSSGETGHVEAIEVIYDPRIVSYADLLSIFWSNVDPTDADGQFCDKGSQYHAGIFYFGDTQKKLAEESAAKVEAKLGRKRLPPLSAPPTCFMKPRITTRAITKRTRCVISCIRQVAVGVNGCGRFF